MSDDLRNRVARAIDPEAFKSHDTCLDVWESRRETAHKAADAAFAEMGAKESQLCDECDGDGRRRFMRQTPHGPVDDADECSACEGTGILAAIDPAPVSVREAARVLLDALNGESELDDVIQTAMQGEADTNETDEWVFVLRAGLRAITQGKSNE